MVKMIYKKTFWMNVFLFISLPFLYYISYATDIDYVEHTTRQKIFTVLAQIFFLLVPVITAIHLYKSNWALVRKLALICNYIVIVSTILFLIFAVYQQPLAYMDTVLLLVVLMYVIFLLPFAINIKAIKAS
jgi:hypothetical protein